MPDDEATTALRSLRDTLRADIPSVDDFVFTLSSALSSLGLSTTLISEPPKGAAKAIRRQLPGVQQSLITVLPTFLPALDSRGRATLDTFFVPPQTPPEISRAIALVSYLTMSSLLAPAATLPVEALSFVLDTLASLSQAYGIDKLYWAADGELLWEDAVRAATSLPVKAANAVGRWREAGWQGDVPAALVPRAYFSSLSRRLEGLAYELAISKGDSEPLRMLLAKLSSIGLLAPPPDDNRQPALMPSFLPPALEHLHPPLNLPAYPEAFFPGLLLPLPSTTLSALADALLAYLPYRVQSLEPDVPDERVKRAAVVLRQFVGAPEVRKDAWNAITLSLLSGKLRGAGDKTVQSARRRTVVAWVGQGGTEAAGALLDYVLAAWSDPKWIKFSAYDEQFSWTHTLLLALSLLPPFDPRVIALSRKGSFIRAVQAYLSHPDGKIRRLGMLVAEVVSERTIEEDSGGPTQTEDEKVAALVAELGDEENEPGTQAPKPPSGPTRLRFSNMWEGEGEGKEESRWLRSCVGVRDDDAVISGDPKGWMLGWDVEPEEMEMDEKPKPEPKPAERGRKSKPEPKRPKIVMLDDEQAADPLEGYASSPSSSRSPSPTPSFLEEVAADPTLALDATKKRKLRRPVYVRQLAELLRDKDKPESIELALQWGEGLVRAKRNFGTEVSDNAIAVAGAAIALSNPFNLDDFDTKRQGLVTALVAAAPRVVPPFLAEQYFAPSYSLLQKSVMLTAIAMGARELAGLPVPQARITRDFPTKTLPPALHAKYLSEADTAGQLEEAVSGMRNLLLSKGAAKGEQVPEIARERQLRVGAKRPKTESGILGVQGRGEVGGQHQDPVAPVIPYASVAGEFFILPLVNRFWDFFTDASVRESRALAAGGRYRGAGTGMVLSPMALEKFLLTLALLTHAARFAPTFLGVLCPAVLEVGVTVGARHPADPGIGEEGSNEGSGEAQVVSAALELTLSVLDAAVDTDAGRTLARDSPEVLLAAGEWASAVFEAEGGRGARAGGSGGAAEGRIRAASAGVVVKIAEVGEKWGGMGGMR